MLVLYVYEAAERYNTMQGYDAMLALAEALAREVVDDSVSHCRRRESPRRAGARLAPPGGHPHTALEENAALLSWVPGTFQRQRPAVSDVAPKCCYARRLACWCPEAPSCGSEGGKCDSNFC